MELAVNAPHLSHNCSIYSSWFESVIVSAEGRVEHQNRNQTATSKWLVGFVFGV